jgi:hypothetical protein
VHGREKFFVVKWFDEKGDRANRHGRGTRSQIVALQGQFLPAGRARLSNELPEVDPAQHAK